MEPRYALHPRLTLHIVKSFEHLFLKLLLNLLLFLPGDSFVSVDPLSIFSANLYELKLSFSV